jgi:hypothetical protein
MDEGYFEVRNISRMVGGLIAGSFLFVIGIISMIVCFVNKNIEVAFGFVSLAFAILGAIIAITLGCLLYSVHKK